MTVYENEKENLKKTMNRIHYIYIIYIIYNIMATNE